MTEDLEPEFVIGYIDGEATIIDYSTPPAFTNDADVVDKLIAAFKEQGTFEPQED